MPYMNRVVVMGHMTKDPEFKTTGNNLAIAEFSIAYSRGKDKESDFFDVTAFGKTAEFLQERTSGDGVGKGWLVTVEGQLRQDRWQDKQTGQGRSKVGIVANRVHTLRPPRSRQAAPQEKDDDLPF